MPARRGVMAILGVTVISVAALPAHAFGQTVNERVVISVNGAYQTGTSDVSSTVGFTANAEQTTFAYKFAVKPGPALDVMGRIRLIRTLGIGVAYTSFSANGPADITSQIPHPFFFNQPRNIAGQASLDRKETALHVRATISSAPGRRLQFTVFAGPVFFSMKQDLVSSVAYTDAYPYDTATFASAATKQVSQSKTGFGAGVDVAYYFSKNIGVGAVASIARATISAMAADNSAVSIDVGGTTFGVGLRVRF